MTIHSSRSLKTLGSKALVLTSIASMLAGCGAPALQKNADRTYNGAMAIVNRVESSPSLAEQAGSMVVGGNANADRLAAQQRSPSVVRRVAAPYIGSVMVPATTEDKLPPIFSEPFVLDFSDARDGSGGVSLSVAMARLSRLTSVPVRVQADVYSAPRDPGATQQSSNQGSAGLMPGAPMPSPLLTNGGSSRSMPASSPVTSAGVAKSGAASGKNRLEPASSAMPQTAMSVDMKYTGTIAGYLNGVTDRLGLAWEYRDNTIVVMRFVNEIHEVFTVAGSTKYALGTGGGGGGQAGGSGASSNATSTGEVTEAGEVAVMASIMAAVGQMTSEVVGSSVTQGGSGRLVVKTSREMQSRVRDYIKTENSSMRRQAQIQFDIYSVVIDDSDERGIDWTAALASLSHPAFKITGGAPASLVGATAATAAFNILSGVAGSDLSSSLGNSKLILQALAQKGYSAQHRPISLLALNRQWARASRLSTEYYLSETTPGPASSTGVGAPGLKTDHITTGDRYLAMPQILDDNTILLKFDLSLSDLLGLFDVTTGSGSTLQKVQAPRTTAINAQMPIALRPGEIMAITGLTREVATSDSRSLHENAPTLMGGSRKLTTKHEHFLIFVRPVIL